jgi:hypothetical protein
MGNLLNRLGGSSIERTLTSSKEVEMAEDDCMPLLDRNREDSDASSSCTTIIHLDTILESEAEVEGHVEDELTDEMIAAERMHQRVHQVRRAITAVIIAALFIHGCERLVSKRSQHDDAAASHALSPILPLHLQKTATNFQESALRSRRGANEMPKMASRMLNSSAATVPDLGRQMGSLRIPAVSDGNVDESQVSHASNNTGVLVVHEPNPDMSQATASSLLMKPHDASLFPHTVIEQIRSFWDHHVDRDRKSGARQFVPKQEGHPSASVKEFLHTSRVPSLGRSVPNQSTSARDEGTPTWVRTVTQIENPSASKSRANGLKPRDRDKLELLQLPYNEHQQVYSSKFAHESLTPFQSTSQQRFHRKETAIPHRQDSSSGPHPSMLEPDEDNRGTLAPSFSFLHPRVDSALHVKTVLVTLVGVGVLLVLRRVVIESHRRAAH